MNNLLCPYKDILGKPNTGVHSYRILNIAIVDVIATLLLAIIISFISKQNVLLIFCILIIISLFIHKLFCVDTTLTKLVFNK